MVFVGLSLLFISLSTYAVNDPAFEGHYERYDNGQLDTNTAYIDLIKLESNKYNLSGTSVWIGNSSHGLVNIGEIDGVVTSDGNQMNYDVDGCTLQILLNPNSLVISKDNGCGGLNVSFNGRYVKTPDIQ